MTQKHGRFFAETRSVAATPNDPAIDTQLVSPDDPRTKLGHSAVDGHASCANPILSLAPRGQSGLR
jgi:hypothetical protein